ncbi:pilus assembly protein [Teredinibacter purpureus]|uniref:pilus assembly protein n=1 Tax=Teredinibacter purpureus TaxID=2731756 RepID=UPI0005F7F511|nr:PilC/PilY family type IV pilus protein [Teredinibacter purpureus]
MKKNGTRFCMLSKYLIARSLHIGVASGLMFIATIVMEASAGPLVLSKEPLYTGVDVKPNVLFLIDDSRSMYFQVSMTPEAKAVAATIINEVGGFFNEYGGAGFWDRIGNFEIDLTPNDLEQYLELCVGYNALAFDPSVDYGTWVGYGDANVVNMLKNPRNASAGTTPFATAHYVDWIEVEGVGTPGVYDFGECGASRTVNGGGVVQYNYDVARIHAASDLPSAEKKQDYANWYTYHRSRDLLFKTALSTVFENLQTRAGLATINANAGFGWGVEMKNVDNLSDPTDTTLAQNKAALLSTLYSVSDSDFARYTPLRRALENAGRYFLGDYNNYDVQTGFVTASGQPQDPVLSEAEGGACQQNHTILATDGYRSEYTSTNYMDGTYGNADAENPDNPYDGGLYGDTVSNTLGDIAMHFYKNDLRPTLPNRVNANNPTDDTNPDTNTAQHMVTHTLSFGISGNIGGPPPLGGWEGGEAWPTVITNESPETLDDLIHAAFNGRGEYLSAQNITSLQDSLSSVIDTIKQSVEGTGAAVGFNSTSIAEGAVLYQGKFNSSQWSGELHAFDYSTGRLGRATWEANERLETLLETRDRKIVTFNGSAGVPFVAPSDYANPNVVNGDLSAAQIADLLVDGPSNAGGKQAYLEDIIEHLRADGDGTYNATRSFREKEGVLGDIVHSSPQYVGKPSAGYPNYIESSSAPYSDFVSSKENRVPMIYVGANDGMLHGFRADTGMEVFGYIPQDIFSASASEGLHRLANPNYTHLPYVDATPTTADVYVNGGWKTYMVGGLGAGGKSVYVLDVTNPAGISTEGAMASNVVVAEFTDSTLGYTFSRPRIAKMNDGEWVAIFGNGYNNSTDGEAYLYILYLDGSGPNNVTHQKIGPLGRGALGAVVNGDCGIAGSDCNGLSSPTLLDLNGDSKVDRVFAGDLQGNMWAFDFTQYDTGNNYIEPVVAHRDVSDYGVPLFSACRGAKPTTGYCADGDRQSITHKPVVVAHERETSQSTEPNLLVLFGTGRYLASVDVTDTAVQSFYGVWDAGESQGEVRQTQLVPQTVGDASGGDGRRKITSTTDVDYTVGNEFRVGANYGWYLNLPMSKERVVIDPAIAGNLVLFVTTTPLNDVCNRAGTGSLMAVDLFSGGQPPFHVFPGEASDVSSVPITALPGGMVILDDSIIISDSDANINSYEGYFEPKRPSRRSAWSIRK